MSGGISRGGEFQGEECVDPYCAYWSISGDPKRFYVRSRATVVDLWAYIHEWRRRCELTIVKSIHGGWIRNGIHGVPSETASLFQRLVVALQRGNALSFVVYSKRAVQTILCSLCCTLCNTRWEIVQFKNHKVWDISVKLCRRAPEVFLYTLNLFPLLQKIASSQLQSEVHTCVELR